MTTPHASTDLTVGSAEHAISLGLEIPDSRKRPAANRNYGSAAGAAGTKPAFTRGTDMRRRVLTTAGNKNLTTLTGVTPVAGRIAD
jgi:hypothetical protein